MAYLVRKISRAKWPDQVCNIEELNGDAISDLRTTANTLSLWRVEDLDAIDEAALALAASSKSEHIETLHVVWFCEDDVLKQGFILADDSPGDTIISSMVNDHRDLCELNYKSLGKFSEMIMQGVAEKNCRRYPKAIMKKAFVDAYRKDLIDKQKCQQKLLNEILLAAKAV